MPLRELPYERLEPLLRDHISTDEDLPTAELIRELRPARARGYLTKAELEAVCRWKSSRAIHRIRSNTARRVRSAVTGTTGASLFAGVTMRKATLDPGAAARFAPGMGKPFVFDIALAWWDRFRGKLEPRPCPFSGKGILELRVRTLLASPRRVVGAFGLAAGARVLEIGPGTGYYSVEAARRIGHTGQLICLELQRGMALAVRHRLTASGHASAYVLQGDARGVPLRNGSVDHVFLVAVLGEIPNRREALAEIHRVLRPGGRLSVSEQLPDPDFVTPRALRRELRAAGFIEQITRGHLWYTSTWMTVG